MKWKDMSVFQRVLQVIGAICALAYLVWVVLFIADCLPNPYERPLPQVLFGSTWLCQAILLWETRRGTALLYMVTAAISIFCAIVAAF